ncbi:MAG: nucleoside transporter C-terminal domain-containing protein [Bacteroidota bacterium]|jgi:CNT family concentrative nucleoside transporter|nr:nucleoside transporter C-terminal domain-containing protein [Bacteroidota bacterium]|tara:strand:+ start:1776 stop:3179 length:1404 start_codon:yes stop_codon:yes gene_type:complete
MKFLTDKKKIFLTSLLFIAANTFVFAQEQDIIPSNGFTLEGFLRGLLGISFLILTTYLLSSNKKAINWKTASTGLLLQLILAVGVLKISWVKMIFESAGKVFVKILDFTMEGTKFLFGDLVSAENFGNVFIFSILPTVIFFAALTSILFYLGIIQKIVRVMALLLSKLLGVSGPESLSVAGNIFLGQTESPLMIKAYLEKMSKSEILLVMIGGMATVAGGVLAAYIGFLGGDDPELKVYYAKHLLTASVMAAPGAIVISKILYPETEKIDSNVEVSQDKIGSNFLDAISIGTSEGLKLAANIAAMLLVFIAFIALINYILSGFGELTNLNDWISDRTVYSELSLELILGYIFAPVMWLIGVAKEDVTLMGQLLGIKLAASEFIGYIQLSDLKDATNLIHLNYQKSIIIATYMLCGFANFASIGIQIGGIGALEPKQRKNLSKFGFKALIGGTLASLLSATIAGMIIG